MILFFFDVLLGLIKSQMYVDKGLVSLKESIINKPSNGKMYLDSRAQKQ